MDDSLKKRKTKFSVLFCGINDQFSLPSQRVTVDGKFTPADLKKLLQLEEDVQFVLQLPKGAELLRGPLENVCARRSVEIFVISSPETLTSAEAPISVLRATTSGAALVGLHCAEGDNLRVYGLAEEGGAAQLAAGSMPGAPVLCADWVSLDSAAGGVLAAGCAVGGKLALWRWTPDEPRLTCVAELVGHARQVASVAAAADGRLLVSAGAADGTVKLWLAALDNAPSDADSDIPHRRRHPERAVVRRPPRLTWKLPVAADGFQWGALAADWFTAEQVVVAGQDRWLRFYQLTEAGAEPEPVLKLQLSAAHGLAALATRHTAAGGSLLACALNANAAPVLLVDVRAEQAVTHRLRRSAHCALALRWNPSCAEQLAEIGRDALNVWDLRQSSRPLLHLANDRRPALETASAALDWVDEQRLVAAQHDELWTTSCQLPAAVAAAS